MKNKKIIEKGAYWFICDGANIHIWNSLWIPSIPSFKPRPNVHVAELPHFFVDNFCLLALSLGMLIYYMIFLIPHLSRISLVFIFLKPDLKTDGLGLFSLWYLISEVSLPSSSRPSPISKVDWQTIWGLTLQARLQHLLWKIAWDLLSFRANIERFVIAEDPLALVCPFCKGPLKTFCHIFLDCDLARILWRSSLWPISTSSFSSKPLLDWILAIIYHSDRLAIPLAKTRKFQLFVALTLDFIWFSKNKLIHEAIQSIPRKAIQQIKVSLEFHLSPWHDAALPSWWLPPRPGCFKGKFDVAIRGNFAVVEAVISNSSRILFLQLHKNSILRMFFWVK